MAIQTQMYPDDLGSSFAASQDYCYMDNNIHNTNNNLYNNDLVFNLQQQQPCLFQFQDLQNPNQVACYSGFLNSVTPTTTASFDQKPPLHFSHLDYYYSLEKEIDGYVVSQQEERLKVALQRQTRKQMGEIWRGLEAKGMMIMQQKKQEIEKAKEKRRELEERIRKVEAEKEAWRRMAVEKEAMVISLNKAFEEAKEEGRGHYCCMNMTSPDPNGVQLVVVVDAAAESCCDVGNKHEEMIKCKVCMVGEACVLLLPCRHFCCCFSCLTFLHACPLCHSPNKASIHALLS